MKINRMCSTVFVTLLGVSVALASFALKPAIVHPSRPDTCYVKENSKVYTEGESWRLAGCAMGTCLKIGSKMMISYESCGSVGLDPSCKVKEDKDAEFPDCCPEVVCPDSIEQEYGETLGDDDSNNELDASFKNQTEPEQVISEFYYDQYPLSDESKSRTFRKVENDMDLQSLDNENTIADSYSSEDNNEKADLNDYWHAKKTFSPKFFYWA